MMTEAVGGFKQEQEQEQEQETGAGGRSTKMFV
jgi:hypothetical protein